MGGTLSGTLLISQFAQNQGLLADAEWLVRMPYELGSRHPLSGLVLSWVLKHLTGIVNGFEMHFSELFITSPIRPGGTVLPSTNSAWLPCWRLLSHPGKARYLPNMAFLDPPFRCNEPTGLIFELLPFIFISPLPILPAPPYPPASASQVGTFKPRRESNSQYGS